MKPSAAADEREQPVESSAARRNWRRTGLRVRSVARFKLQRHWSKPVPASSRDAVVDGATATFSLAKYERLGVLGVGAAAVVYLVRHRGSRQLFAMKVQSCPTRQPWPRRTFHARKEQYILQSLRHPFVCRLHEAFHDAKRLYLVLEYHAGGSLDDVRAFCGGALPEHAVKVYAAELVQALKYVHTMGFVYRDLKPQNVLVAADGHIRLTDFGVAHEGLPEDLSRYDSGVDNFAWLQGDKLGVTSGDETTATATTETASTRGEDDDDGDGDDENEDEAIDPFADASNDFDEWGGGSPGGASPRLLGVDDRVRLRSNSFVGTVDYMPPEMIQQVASQSSDVDWWALGCLVYELVYGVSPFRTSRDSSTKQVFHRILVGKVEFPLFPRVSESCKDLIRRLLRRDPRQRLGHSQGSAEVKNHPFFRGVSWAYLSDDAPVRVRGRCLSCLRHKRTIASITPPFLDQDDENDGRADDDDDGHADEDEDDAVWRRWNELLDEPPSDPHDCGCDGEPYESPSAPMHRLQAFMRSQSERFASFRAPHDKR